MKRLSLTKTLIMIAVSPVIGLNLVASIHDDLSLKSLKKGRSSKDIYNRDFIDHIMFKFNIPFFKGDIEDMKRIINNWNKDDPQLLRTKFELIPGSGKLGTIADEYAIEGKTRELTPQNMRHVGGLYVRSAILDVLKELGLQTLSEEQITNIAQSEVDKIIAKREKFEEEMRRLDELSKDLSLKSLKEYMALVKVDDSQVDIYNENSIRHMMTLLDREIPEGSDERIKKVIKSWNNEDPKLLGTTFELVHGSNIHGTIADEYAADILVKDFLPSRLKNVRIYVRDSILKTLQEMGLQTLSAEKIKEVAKLKADEIIANN